jgi:hypothetical protein
VSSLFRHSTIHCLAWAKNMRLLLIAATVLLGACAQPQLKPSSETVAEAALVKLDGEGEFVETSRQPDHSIVEVRKAPAGSVASSLYALRGACAVLRARAAPFVASQRLAGAVPTYRLTFPAAPTADALTGATKNTFSKADCTALRF